MFSPPITDEMCLEAVEIYQREGSQEKAATILGIRRSTLTNRLKRAAERGITPGHVIPVAEALPPEDLPFDVRLATMKQRNALRIAHAKATAWQTVRVPIAGPYGLCWFGDPHLDDPFCDLSAIERHATICRDTPGMFGVNGGDTINNWVGKLERLYAEQSTTASEGWELVEWMIRDLGVNWLLWLLGNHDTWNYGKRIFDGLNTQRVLMRDWDARLRLVSSSGETRVWARHDFKGHSIYNELHGLKRAAMMEDHADIYAAFHRHTFGTSQHELPNGRDATLVRARGYKESDDYALKGQFHEQSTGQSVVTIVDPRMGAAPLVHVFKDVETGADFLTFLRRKRAA